VNLEAFLVDVLNLATDVVEVAYVGSEPDLPAITGIGNPPIRGSSVDSALCVSDGFLLWSVKISVTRVWHPQQRATHDSRRQTERRR
jgi:hypothetical protein